jgi:hypothetical protein
MVYKVTIYILSGNHPTIGQRAASRVFGLMIPIETISMVSIIGASITILEESQ